MRRHAKTLAHTALLMLAASGGAAAQEITATARLASAVYLGDAPTVIAESRGFFAREGVRLEITYLDSGKESMKKLRAGEADFALTAATPVILDRLADPDPGGPDDPVILASLVHSDNLLGIATPDDSGIREPMHFRGKRVGVNRGTNTEFIWWLYEQYHGLERSSVELIDLPFSEMPAALASGRIDAAVLWEPWVSRHNAANREAGRPDLRHIHLEGLYAGKWLIVTSRQTARERSALCHQLLNAYDQAIDFIETAPDTAAAAYSRQLGIKGGIDIHHWQALDYELDLDWSLIASLQEQFHWARAAGYENAGGPIRLLELLEPAPLMRKRPGAVGIPTATLDEPAP